MGKNAVLMVPAGVDQADIDRIEARFSEWFKKKIVFDVVVDNSLIGGFVAQVDGKNYDVSIKTRLDTMQNELKSLSIRRSDTGKNVQQMIEDNTIDVQSVAEVLKKRLSGYVNQPQVYDLGYVISSGDGIVRVGGLARCRNDELLEFENGIYGIAMDLALDSVGAVLLDDEAGVSVGTQVKGTGLVTKVPVGNSLLGRVVDPIGRPLDGLPALSEEWTRDVEFPAPSIIDRQDVDTPLETGLLVVDSMIAIGRGQRELIIGDRQTGKTTIALDTIINQKGKNIKCVYVAIGQKASSIANVVHMLQKNGAMEYTTVVAATASDCAAMQYLAPYAGCAIAEEFMYNGEDALIVYDDLSKHAVAYRTMSLLLQRPPGREAYPGDVFYLHSRLLERAARMKDGLGGSITALPIVETMAGDISTYIPTNVISITDGQIFLETDLFHSGIRPAVNVGLSVSRVGRAAQKRALRDVSGILRLELAQYRELAVFTQFGSDVDSATRQVLNRGQHLQELLKQKQHSPYSLAQQVALLLCYNEAGFDDVPMKDMPHYIEDFLAFMDQQYRSSMEEIQRSGKLDDTVLQRLKSAIHQFVEAAKDEKRL